MVGRNNSEDPTIEEFSQSWAARAASRAMLSVADIALDPLAGRLRGARLAATTLRQHPHPRRLLEFFRGRDNFSFPQTASSIERLGFQPDCLHCHNLHGRYFDLRALAPLSRKYPTFLTLHDEWMLTGHCAYTLGCERWRDGCGECPDLNIYPALFVDGTRENVARKARIYAQSQLFVSAPSQWLIDRARHSVLSHAAKDFRVINNGVDTDTFRPKTKADCRGEFGIAPEDLVVCFAANAANRNMFKDYTTVVEAGRKLGSLCANRSITLLILGGDAGHERHDNVNILNLGYVSDQDHMATAYGAADFYLHAAHGENFPTTILEALACGVPVVATSVGGIPEQVQSCIDQSGALMTDAVATANGALVPPRAPDAMARAVAVLSRDEKICERLRTNARHLAVERFDRRRQIRDTLNWYRDCIPNWQDSQRHVL